MRYGEQVFEIAVPLDDVDWDAPGLPQRVTDAFHARHESAVHLCAARRGGGAGERARRRHRPPAGHAGAAAPPARAPAAPFAARRARLGGGRGRAAGVRLRRAGRRASLAGPAIIESDTTTVLLLAGDQASMDARGWLALTLPRRALRRCPALRPANTRTATKARASAVWCLTPCPTGPPRRPIGRWILACAAGAAVGLALAAVWNALLLPAVAPGAAGIRLLAPVLQAVGRGDLRRLPGAAQAAVLRGAYRGPVRWPAGSRVTAAAGYVAALGLNG